MGTKTVIPIKQLGAGAAQPNPEALLEAQGWLRRTTIGEPRLSEVVENYRAMGYEVHVERFQTADDASCTTCYDDPAGQAPGKVWGTVYVRKGPAESRGADELF